MLAAFALTAGAACLAMHGTGWGQAAAQAAGSSVAASVAQSTAQSSDTTLRVTSRETVVDVTVTDAKGRAIHGLKQYDFVVKEDGKPQPVRSFQEFSEITPPAVRTLPPLPPNVYTNLQKAPTTSAVNILLLDALNTQAVDQVVMKQESLKYLKSMPSGTRIAVLALGSSLRILQGFTSDPGLLIAVVDSKKNRALPSPFIDNDSGGVLDDQVDAQTELGNDDIAAGVQQFENELATEQQDIRNRMTLEALNQIAAYVNGIKGRKNLIWFTEGMPLNMFPSGGTNDLAEITDYAKDVRRTTDLLAAAEVAVYPVDVRKLFNNPANGADHGLSTINVHTAANQVAQQAQFRLRTGQEQVSMSAVAEATGGVAYFNTNDLKGAVDKAIENGANYYSLSYIPPDLNFDGRFHNIDVQVDRPGVHLSYRKGYNADDIVHNAITPMLPLTTSAPEPYGSNMQASMGRGVPTASQVLFDVRVTPSAEPAKPGDAMAIGTLDPKLQGKALVRYDVLYFIPEISSQIVFALGADGSHKCSLEFDLAAYDVFGKRITGLSQTSNSPPFTAGQYQQFLKQKQFQFLQQIDLPPGEIFLRVGVLDAVSQKVGTLEIPLHVAKPAAAPAGESGGKGSN
jgi:VWFA-related protein